MGIRGHLATLWGYSWLIVLTTLTAATATATVASIRSPIYRVEARAGVRLARDLGDSKRDVRAIGTLSGPAIAGTIAQLSTTGMVRDAARRKLASPPADDTAYTFQVRPLPGSMGIQIIASGPDPVVLAAYTEATLEATADAAQALYDPVGLVPLGSVSVPDAPARPNPSRDMPLAVVLGLAAGLMLALAAAYLGDAPGRGLAGAPAVALAGTAGGGIGVAAALGAPVTLLAAAVAGPFALLIMFARPSWAVPFYVALVYADLLSVLTRYHGVPPLARFLGLALLAAVLGHRLLVRREPLAGDGLTWWLLAYGLVVAAGLLYARDSGRVATNLIEYGRTMLTYYIVINAARTTALLRRILWAILAIGVFLAALTIFQSLTGDWGHNFGGLAQSRTSDIVGDVGAPRPGGTLNDANYYGLSLLVQVPLGLYLAWDGSVWRRLAGALAVATLILAIVFTYSRGDAIALGAVVIATVLYKRPRPLGLAGFAVAGILVVALLPMNYRARLATVAEAVTGNQSAIYNESSLRGRVGALDAGLGIFLDHPLFGVGRENYDLYEAEYLAGTEIAQSSRGIPPHNLYLEIAAEHGLVGVALVGGFLLATWRAMLEARRRFLMFGDQPQAELAGWLGIALFGYLVGSLFLHGAFIYQLWLQVTLLATLRRLARGEEERAAIRER